jgi:ribosomal protein L11 methyltransferase
VTVSQPDLFRVEVLFPGHVPELLEPFLSERAPWGWQEEDIPGGVRIRIHFPLEHTALDTAKRIKTLFPESVPEVGAEQQSDWSLSWREFFEPVHAGRFLVLPPWLNPDEVDPSATPIVIEPKMAFGTGHHPTTFLCLQAIDELCPPDAPPGRRFLDLGTGSGILGIACAKAGLVGIGLDIDPVAVENARENSENNLVRSSFAVGVGTLDCLRPGVGFDLIVANILARPLADMAPLLAARILSKGGLILSGLLRDQEVFVTTAYRQQGLSAPQIIRNGEWSALIWKPQAN